MRPKHRATSRSALVEIYRALGGGWQIRTGAGADAPQVNIPQCVPATTVEPLPLGVTQPVTPLIPANAADKTPKKLPPTTADVPPSQPWAKEPE